MSKLAHSNDETMRLIAEEAEDARGPAFDSREEQEAHEEIEHLADMLASVDTSVTWTQLSEPRRDGYRMLARRVIEWRPMNAPSVDRDVLIEQCAVAAEQQDRTGREWVKDSLWAAILKRAGDNVRALKARP